MASIRSASWPQAGGGHALAPVLVSAAVLRTRGRWTLEVFDVDLEAAGAQFAGKELCESGCPFSGLATAWRWTKADR